MPSVVHDLRALHFALQNAKNTKNTQRSEDQNLSLLTSFPPFIYLDLACSIFWPFVLVFCSFACLLFFKIFPIAVIFTMDPKANRCHNIFGCNMCYLSVLFIVSRVAQWKRAGPITHGSEYENLALLTNVSSFSHFISLHLVLSVPYFWSFLFVCFVCPLFSPLTNVESIK